jgi:transcription factor-like protein
LGPEFQQIISKGNVLFKVPDQALLRSIVYQPSKVSERGWVLLFNCIIANSKIFLGPEYADLVARLRWNTWTALNDSTLFTEPTEANIQALLSLATHGDDFATPSMSWTITGHACRLAQAMKLQSLETRGDKRRIFLFWALFTIDKSVSLAFGRPPMLSSQYYEHVPLPDLEFLAGFEPHKDPQGSMQQAAQSANFGASYFLTTVKMGRLTGKITDFLYSWKESDTATYNIHRNSLKSELDNWYQDSIQVGLCIGQARY